MATDETRPEVQGSSFIVSLTVAQLSELVRREIREALAQTGHDDRLLDADEVAKMLGVDSAYVYSQARAKKIPSIKLGKYRKFSPSQLKKWLARQSA
jgi:excisionase family DNA binding protein